MKFTHYLILRIILCVFLAFILFDQNIYSQKQVQKKDVEINNAISDLLNKTIEENKNLLDFSRQLAGTSDFNTSMELYRESRVIKYQLGHFSNYFGIIVLSPKSKSNNGFIRDYLLDKLKEMRLNLDESAEFINHSIVQTKSYAVVDSAKNLKNVLRSFYDLIDKILVEYK